MPVQDKWDRRAKRNYERKHNLVEQKVHVDGKKWSRFDHSSDEEQFQPAAHVKEVDAEVKDEPAESVPVFEATLEQFEQSRRSTAEDRLIKEQIQRVQREYTPKRQGEGQFVVKDSEQINRIGQYAEDAKLRERVKKRFGQQKRAELGEDNDFDEFMSTIELKGKKAPKRPDVEQPTIPLDDAVVWTDSLL